MDVTNVEMVAMQMGFEEKEEVDRYKVDLAHTRIIVTAWPDNRWPVEISLWIEDLMKDVVSARPDYRISLRQKTLDSRSHTVGGRNTTGIRVGVEMINEEILDAAIWIVKREGGNG